MAPVNNGVDVSSNDELKVYRVEGEEEDEERSSAENLKEVKNSLVIEVTEEEEKRKKQAPSESFLPSKSDGSPPIPAIGRPDHIGGTFPAGRRLEPYLPFPYVVSPYPPHPNSPYGGLPMVNHRVTLGSPHHNAPHSLSMLMYNVDRFQHQPPPAHMGISPVLDPKTGIPRPPAYSLSAPRQFHPTPFSTDFAPQLAWSPRTIYSVSGFQPQAYPPSIPFSAANMPSSYPPPTLIHSPLPTSPHHHHHNHHSLMPTGPKIEISESQDNRNLHNFNYQTHSPSPHQLSQAQHASRTTEGSPSPRMRNEKKKMHIKKPLNAFMLYMKEQRPLVMAECTLKESAAINQILGKRWHELSREEQTKYYDMAREERQVHQQKYPGWTARDNYAINAKKKKRKRDKSQEGDGINQKKCRARFGVDQQSSWCKPCRRKKKCIRYCSGSGNTTGESDNNIGSVESVGSLEAPTPDSRYSGDGNDGSDNDSGNVEDDAASSELSNSSPSVPRPSDNVQSDNSRPLVPVQHLSSHHASESPELELAHISLPQLPTPPSTDSSTATAPLLGIS